MQDNISQKARQAFQLWCDMEQLLSKMWDIFDYDFIRICQEDELDMLDEQLEEAAILKELNMPDPDGPQQPPQLPSTPIPS